jgi:hypothetical protein
MVGSVALDAAASVIVAEPKMKWTLWVVDVLAMATKRLIRPEHRHAVRGVLADRGIVARLHGIGRACRDALVDPIVVVRGERPASRVGGPDELPSGIGGAAGHLIRPDRHRAARIAEVGPAFRRPQLQRALGERLGQAAQLGREVALRRQPCLAQRAAPQPDLAVAVGVLPVDERDPDLGPVEQPGAHLILDDAALGEHPDQIQIVDREPGIAPDRRALEPGIRSVCIAAEDDVPVVIGEEELLAVGTRDPPDRREPGGRPIEMRPHGRGEVLGHGRLRSSWSEEA